MSLNDLPVMQPPWEFPAVVREIAVINTKEDSSQIYYVIGKSRHSSIHNGKGRGPPCIIVDTKPMWDESKRQFIANELNYRLIPIHSITLYKTNN